MILDTIIIGSGPAGVAAAIYAVRREMTTVLLGKTIGGQLIWAADVENYPGFASISNFDLIVNFQKHLEAAKVKQLSQEVKSIEVAENGHFILHTEKEKFTAKTVIAALGLMPKRLAIPGENEFLGKGVSYCANCDGPIYRNRKVAVVGFDESAIDAVDFLSKIAAEVIWVNRKANNEQDQLTQSVISRPNVTAFFNANVKQISGSSIVESITVASNDTEETYAVSGVFVELGRVAHTDLVAELVERDSSGQIIVNERCETSTPGLYAAGDVTTVPFKQISVAVGQGTIAALAAYQYIQGVSGNLSDRSRK